MSIFVIALVCISSFYYFLIYNSEPPMGAKNKEVFPVSFFPGPWHPLVGFRGDRGDPPRRPALRPASLLAFPGRVISLPSRSGAGGNLTGGHFRKDQEKNIGEK